MMNRPRVGRVVASLAVAAAAIGAVGVREGATPAKAAAACSLTPTGGTVTRTVNGFRSYNLRVPAGLTAPAPVLLSLHGLGSFPFGQEFTTGWSPYADSQKFIVAYPAGNFNAWDPLPGSGDITFLRQVVDKIAAKYCVDASRVYVEGGSLGSWMAQRLACDASDKFAAVVGTSGGSPNLFGGCSPSRPVGAAFFHGEADPLITVSMGEQTRDEWAARNGCDPTPIVEDVPSGHAQSYAGCDASVSVAWRSYAGLGHAYPTGADGSDFRDRAWDFLTAHTLP